MSKLVSCLTRDVNCLVLRGSPHRSVSARSFITPSWGRTRRFIDTFFAHLPGKWREQDHTLTAWRKEIERADETKATQAERDRLGLPN